MPVRRTRSRNYWYLSERLEQDNISESYFVPTDRLPIRFTHQKRTRHPQRTGFCGYYIPVYWNNVIVSMPEESVEYDLCCQHSLPLPVTSAMETGDGTPCRCSPYSDAAVWRII